MRKGSRHTGETLAKMRAARRVNLSEKNARIAAGMSAYWAKKRAEETESRAPNPEPRTPNKIVQVVTTPQGLVLTLDAAGGSGRCLLPGGVE